MVIPEPEGAIFAAVAAGALYVVLASASPVIVTF